MRSIRDLWYQMIYSGTDEIRDDDLRLGVTKGINFLCAWICMINVVVGPIFYFASKKPSVLYGSLIEAAFVAYIIRLNVKNRRTLANICFYVVLLIATFYFSVILGPMAQAQFMIVLMAGLAFFLFETKKVRILCTAASACSLILIEINYKLHVFRSAVASPNVTYAMRWTAYCVIILLVVMLFYLFDKNYRKLLNKQRIQNKIVQSDLETQTMISLKKSNLIRMAFHEVRSQFKGMKIMLSVLTKNKSILEMEGMPKMLGDLTVASEVVEMVMGNVLNYSKGEAGIVEKELYEWINLKMALIGLINIHQYDANNKNVKIEYIEGADIPDHLIGDRFKINQIVANLLNNAIKFTRPNTVVTCKLEQNGNFWTISIQDCGKGIPPEKLGQIFDLYVTEKDRDNSEGVGLGLHNA